MFKAPADFSNKEIKDYQFKKVAMPHINGVTAKLRCRPCAGEQVHELQCEGPCGETKPLDCFSKAQRTRGMKVCVPNYSSTFRVSFYDEFLIQNCAVVPGVRPVEGGHGTGCYHRRRSRC